MKKINLGNSSLEASAIVLGCMRIHTMSVDEVTRFVECATEQGINLYDHADIYGGGTCEELFGKMLKQQPNLRNEILIQSKCSIRDGYYDLSKEHICESVDNSLHRLQTDYLDLLILHRPDTLMEPEEVAQAFDCLQQAGKVRNFGVSNFNSMQIELLKTCVEQPLLVNQLQYGIMHAGMINSGIQANTEFEGSIDRDGNILEYSRIKKMTIQAWSPFQYGFFDGIFIGNDKFPELNATLDKIADKYGVSSSAIAVAWIMRHPAKMQTIVGTTNCNRLKDICTADKVELTRAEWYEIYQAAGNVLP